MILYHFTKGRYLESILSIGIHPAYKSGLSLSSSRQWTKVFLTNDIFRIAQTQAGFVWCKAFKPVIFEVEVSEQEIEPHKYVGNGTYTLSNYEYVIDKVLPSQIKNHFTLKSYLKDNNLNLIKTY